MHMTLPIFDISHLRLAPDSDQAREQAEQLREICHNQGFCYLIGHGLEDRAADIFAMMKQFFALPRAERLALDINNSPAFRGYTVLGDELTQGSRDWRDQMDFSLDMPAPQLEPQDAKWLKLRGPNQWPEAMPAMKPLINDWLADMYKIGETVLAALTQSLGLEEDYFDPYFSPRGDDRLKLIRYRVPESGGSAQGVGWHHDTGFLTFIVQDEIGGLQVDIDGQIIDAVPMKGAMIMNMGEMLQVATGGYLRATPHRVKSPPPGRERLSIAYFFNPKLEARFAPIPLPPELAAKARGAQNPGPDDPVFDIVGANILKTRLRAHPKVAERFYK